MDDLEICKRIADIDGVGVEFKKPYNAYFLKGVSGEYEPEGEYNPLTDDALCFGFIVNDKIEIEFDSDLNFVCAIGDAWVNDENLNRAICMVKIKAHKDQS